MWIQGAWEMIGTTQVDLNDYVKFTDYATANKGGVIKSSVTYRTQINQYGEMFASPVQSNGYEAMSINAVIGKGTLENIKANYVKEGMAANMVYDEETETLTITTE